MELFSIRIQRTFQLVSTHFSQPYYDYMNENHKDTLHIESIQQLKKQES